MLYWAASLLNERRRIDNRNKIISCNATAQCSAEELSCTETNPDVSSVAASHSLHLNNEPSLAESTDSLSSVVDSDDQRGLRGAAQQQ